MSQESQVSHRQSRCRSVLVTGASGYIGNLLLRALSKEPRGVEKIVATDIREPASREPRVIYEVLDVRSKDLGRCIADHAVDTVVHLAAVVTPRPEDTTEILYEVDVLGTRNVLEACVDSKASKLIVTSSGAAYGYHPDNARYLSEDSPLRGNESFAYAHHKRLVEEMLAEHRLTHPELKQLVLRVSTILGISASNQITALFDKPVILGLRGVVTPFVFIWDGDVVGCLEAGIHGEGQGVFNLAGDGTVTLREIARQLGKPHLALPAAVVTSALSWMKRFGLTRYGPEQVGFLRYRPVLSNRRLKEELGYRPRYTSREVFELFCQSRNRQPDGTR